MGWTFQTLIDDHMTVTAYCHNSRCHHKAVVPLERFREKYGSDAPAMADDLKAITHCSKCQGTDIGFIYSPPTEPKANAYERARNGR